MNRKLFSLLLFVVHSGLSGSSFASGGIGVSGGYSFGDDVSFVRGAFKFEPESKLLEGDNWYVAIHFDIGFISLNSQSDIKSDSNIPNSLQAISFTPVFRLERTPYANGVVSFIEIGAGASFFSEETLQNDYPEGLDFGGPFQFEDIVSAGLKLGDTQQFEIALNYFHYSNFDIYDQNDGIDIFSATFTTWF